MRTVILLLFLIISPFGQTQPLSCTAPTLRAICSTQDLSPASRSTSLELPLLAFNPIHLLNGNKYLKEYDYVAHPHAPDLEVVRYYDSLAIRYGLLGHHWQLSYEIKITTTSLGSVVTLANGTQVTLSTTDGWIQHQGSQTVWHTYQGEQWHFDSQGWLQAIYRPNQAALHIHRHRTGPLQHRLDYIEQNSHQLRFYYHPTHTHLISHIQTPAGTLHYTYEPLSDSVLLQLKSVIFPDKRVLHYHHEALYQAHNPGLITGKSIQLTPHSTSHRVRSWVYNSNKQVIFLMTEDPSQWVRLHYPSETQANQTLLISPQGQTQITFTISPPAIKTITGALCWACPPNLVQTPQSIQLAQASFSRQLQWLKGDFLGWPQLHLTYDTQQRLTSWSTQDLKPTQLHYNAQGLAHQMLFANGDTQAMHYSPQGELQHIDYYSQNQTWQTQIHRPHPQQLHLSHPHEKEQLHYSQTGLLLSRQVQRYFQPPYSQTTHRWQYQEQFDYDDQQRLIRHHLPEGGALHYAWRHNRLHSIHWESTSNSRLVAQAIAGGLQYGNGLMRWEYHSASLHWLAWAQPHRIWWQQLLVKNNQGLIQTQRFQNDASTPNTPSTQHFSYNAQQQLKRQHSLQPVDFSWKEDGSLKHKSIHQLAHIQRDSSGLAHNYEDRSRHYILRYNPLRRLDLVLDSNKPVQKNSHNSSGFRIYTQHYPQATQQFFLYHEKKIVAEFTTTFEAKLPVHAAHPISRRYIYWHDQPVGMIDYELNPTGELLVIHSDHLGAAHQISDQQQRLRWSAQYDALGAAQKTHGDLDFYLRRSGQYYDLATGWHDNLLRTYLPEQGHYLEPDPLGPNPTSQLYGYARQQPLNHTDPWGLVLFAFDGTRYDERSGGVIYQMHQASNDPSFYHAGPGQADELTWDAMVAYSADLIIQQQWQNLLNYLQALPSSNTPIPIDIIGFSRGAALARHFANQIIQNTQNGLFNVVDSYGNQIQACIQPRFMGLLDSVAQIGILGSRNHLYEFSVAPAWQWVSHAVALHEYRHLFPALLLGSSGSNQQEIGLVGAHGDLGGGYPTSSSPDTQALSAISLQWLLWQAKAQGLSFHTPTTPKAHHAYMHDESAALAQDRGLENHSFTFVPELGVGYTQDYHPTLGRLIRQQVDSFLSFDLTSAEQEHNQSAKVDLSAYYRWLDQTLNWSPD